MVVPDVYLRNEVRGACGAPAGHACRRAAAAAMHTCVLLCCRTAGAGG
jgi:hypothetical protein